jgi:hypothetical protein
MTCPFCLLLFETADAQYVSHVLAEHPQAQLGAALGFLAVSRIKSPVSQLVGYLGLSLVAWLFLRRSLR